MKKILSTLLVAAIVIMTVLCVPAGANYNQYLDTDLHSACAVLICSDNEEVIFSKNPNYQTKPASLTKIVTASVILQEVEDLTTEVTVPESCISELSGTGSSLGGLKAGETLSIYTLLCYLLVESANDAATTLANYLTGSDRQAFVDKMNALAEKLGCKNSHFVNVHGLDDEYQYTTASDMAKFIRNAMKYSAFAEIVSMVTCDIPETNMQEAHTINSTNYTIMSGYKDYYCKYSLGGKTGYTSVAGHCLASSASNNGYNYICVCLNAPKEDFDDDGVDENGAFLDTKVLYDWAFDNLRLVTIAKSTKIVGEVPVKYGDTDYVSLCPAENALGLMPKGTDESGLLIEVKEDTIPEKLSAPIEKGAVICKGQVFYAGDVIAEIDLVASDGVSRNFFTYFTAKVSEWVSSTAFTFIAIFSFIILVVLIVLKVREKKGAGRPVKKAPVNTEPDNTDGDN